MKLSIVQAKLVHRELSERNTPDLLPPLRILPGTEERRLEMPLSDAVSACTMSNCFDWSRCSISSGYPIYFYPTGVGSNEDLAWVYSAKNKSGYAEADPNNACLFVIAGMIKHVISTAIVLRLLYPKFNIYTMPHLNVFNHYYFQLTSQAILQNTSQIMFGNFHIGMGMVETT